MAITSANSQSEGIAAQPATEILLLYIKNNGYAMIFRVSYKTLGCSKSKPGET